MAELTRREAVFVAVNDDSPFLFDSMMAEMNAAGARVHALFHPIMYVARDAEGARSGDAGARRSRKASSSSCSIPLIDTGAVRNP